MHQSGASQTSIHHPDILASAIIDHTVSQHGIHFRALMFGRKHRDDIINWTFDNLNANAPLKARLRAIVEQTGTRKILSPRPGFNAQLTHEARLAYRVHIGGNATVYCNFPGDGAADAIKVNRLSAYAITPANCPVIVATNGIDIVAAHAGRWSLFRQRKSRDGTVAFTAGLSVVDTVITTLTAHRQHPSTIHAWIYGGVHGEDFGHPLTGHYAHVNNALLSHIHETIATDAAIVHDDTLLLDLPHIIARQCENRGVLPAHVSLKHAYLSPHHAWTDGRHGKERNLFFVAHL